MHRHRVPLLARWGGHVVLSLFLRAQVTDCCSSPSGALQRHTKVAGAGFAKPSSTLPRLILNFYSPPSLALTCEKRPERGGTELRSQKL